MTNITKIYVNRADWPVTFFGSIDRDSFFTILNNDQNSFNFSIDITNIEDPRNSGVFIVTGITYDSSLSDVMTIDVQFIAGFVDPFFNDRSIWQITFEFFGWRSHKKENVVIQSTDWSFNGSLYECVITDTNLRVQAQSIIFTPYMRTIAEVIAAVIYPEITIDPSNNQFTLYAQNAPTGDIEGEYLIINAS